MNKRSIGWILLGSIVIIVTGVWYTSTFIPSSPILSPLGDLEEPPEQTIPPEQTLGICTDEYIPVCGSDRQTYSNACQAKQKNIAVISEGACTDPKLQQL